MHLRQEALRNYGVCLINQAKTTKLFDTGFNFGYISSMQNDGKKKTEDLYQQQQMMIS